MSFFGCCTCAAPDLNASNYTSSNKTYGFVTSVLIEHCETAPASLHGQYYEPTEFVIVPVILAFAFFLKLLLQSTFAEGELLVVEKLEHMVIPQSVRNDTGSMTRTQRFCDICTDKAYNKVTKWYKKTHSDAKEAYKEVGVRIVLCFSCAVLLMHMVFYRFYADGFQVWKDLMSTFFFKLSISFHISLVLYQYCVHTQLCSSPFPGLISVP
jgi:hypothetical protein